MAISFSRIPNGSFLNGTVASNKEDPSFAQYVAIKYFQDLLATGRMQSYVLSTDVTVIQTNLQMFEAEAAALLYNQQKGIGDDYQCVQVAETELQDFELNMSIPKLDDSYNTTANDENFNFQKLQELRKGILFMMRSRYALLHQDLAIRQVLVNIESAVNRISSEVFRLIIRVKHYTMGGLDDETLVHGHYWEILKALMPLYAERTLKRGELDHCRWLRWNLERKIRDANIRLAEKERMTQVMEQKQFGSGFTMSPFAPSRQPL